MIDLDQSVQRFVVSNRVDWLDPIFAGASIAGNQALVWLALALAATIWLRRPQVFLLVAATALTTNLVVTAIKLAVGRERPPSVVLDPEPLLEVPTTSSFPSGHAATSFACAFVLSRVLPRLTVPLFALAATVAASRVYVGVHYPLDVLVGSVLGLAVAIALRTLLAALRRSPRAQRAG